MITTIKNFYNLYKNPKVLTLLFFGFSSGLPFMLIFSSLSFWLREANVDKATIGFFSWVGLSFAFKWVWAPFIDRIPIPLLSRLLGRRRGWLLLAQTCIIIFLICISQTNPATHLFDMAIFAIGLSFSSATQDIIVDAYRIEVGNERIQAAMAASYQIGYRIAVLIAGAGTLTIAALAGSNTEYSMHGWSVAYLSMAGIFLIGVITTLIAKEPEISNNIDYSYDERAVVWLRNNSHIPLCFARPIAWFYGTVLCPFIDFFARYRWLAVLLLLLIGTYRISDIVMGVMANPFYHDIGFSKEQIATIIKAYGVVMTLVGATLGGFFINRYGVMKILFVGAVLTCLSNVLFAFLAHVGPDIQWLTVVISIDNFSGGIAASAFIAWLSGLTNVRYSATQYALFSSVMVLFPKFIAGFSGVAVNHMGYASFFIGTAIIGLPVLVLVLLAMKYLPSDNPNNNQNTVDS